MKICKILPKNAKKIDEIFLKYWGLSGAKACKSCRSRQSFPTNIYLQNLASIQKRTSPVKFAHLIIFFTLSKGPSVATARILSRILLFIDLAWAERKDLGLLIFQTDFLRKFWDCSGAKGCKSVRARKMLSNTYFVAKFRFDTAENAPAKNLQNNFRKMHFSKMHFRKCIFRKCIFRKCISPP